MTSRNQHLVTKGMRHELIDIMTAHTRHVQVHQHKIPAPRRGSVHKVPP